MRNVNVTIFQMGNDNQVRVSQCVLIVLKCRCLIAIFDRNEIEAPWTV